MKYYWVQRISCGENVEEKSKFLPFQKVKPTAGVQLLGPPASLFGPVEEKLKVIVHFLAQTLIFTYKRESLNSPLNLV